jgi:hypothetical protein
MMKKIYLTICLAIITIVSFAQQSFTGNGNGGFGDPVGGSNLTIDDDGTTVTFTFTKGAGGFNDVMVIYLDIPGGFAGRTSTSEINDTADRDRRAISNAGSGDLTFPNGFGTEKVISVHTSFVGLWDIPAAEQFAGTITNLPTPTSLNTTFGSGDPTFSFSFDWADIGLTSFLEFDFIIAYGNGSANGDTAMFSSDEGYGAIASGNPGTNAYSITTSETYIGSEARYTTTPSATVWSSPSSWDLGKVPGPNSQLSILHDIDVDVDITLNGLPNNSFVSNNATMTILPDAVVNLETTFFLDSIGDVVFDSDATGSAQLVNGSSGSFAGAGFPTVMRFIPTGSTSPRRAYRFVTSSVNATGSIYDNWQTGGASVAGIGTHITGSTTGANGFDQTVSGNPSMIFYGLDSADGNYKWQAVSNTDVNTLSAGQPFNIFIRGDRNYDLTSVSTPNSDVRLPSKGSLELGATVNSGALNENASGFSFVGNPYQATVNMSTVTKNNVNPNFVYIWNSNAASRGAYETIDMSAASSDPKRFIQPGQAFFVSTIAAGAASLDFKATDKDVSANAVGPFSANNNRPKIDMALFRDLNGSAVQFDRIQLFLDGDNAIGLDDAIKVQNFEESISRNLNGTLLSIENKAMPVNNEIINLDFKNIAATSYTLNIDLNAMTQGLDAVLHDNFDNTDTVLNAGMNAVPLTFDLNDAQSIDPSRFELRFVDTTLSIAQVDGFSFQMFPNPTTDHQVAIRGSFDGKATTATLFNTLGQQVMKSKVNTNESIIDLQGVDAGIYLVKVVSGNNQMTKKLVIK